MTVVPILLYHSVSSDPSALVRPFTVTPDAFAEQLDAALELGCTSLAISQFQRAKCRLEALPPRPVIITFDDGFADFEETALPCLRERGLAATLYVTTGFLGGRPKHASERSFDDRMLSWSQLRDLRSAGVEIGAHTHTHPQLDTLPRSQARVEITLCKDLLEDELQEAISAFAYPHGYSSAAVRCLVREAGYKSACGVKNALSSTEDDVFSLARLTVRATTGLPELRGWLQGAGPAVAPREMMRTRLWRLGRRMSAVTTRQRNSRRR